MITVKSFTFNALQENTYVLYDETKECVIIDPGCYDKQEQNELAAFIENHSLKPVHLLNTHCHVDHVLGNYFVADKYNLTVETSSVEEAHLQSVKAYAPIYGFTQYSPVETVMHIEAGQKIVFGQSALEILSVPGHSPGHLAFWDKKLGICLAGDVLFQGSIGRSDLPGGNYQTLEKSIREVMYTLPNETIVYPGHGPETTIGYEKKNNPFVRA